MTTLETVQEKTINNILSKYENDPTHVKQVTRLALIIFDELKGILHNYSDYERTLLRDGGLLHDIGWYVNADKHNQGSYSMIMKDSMPGFSQEEKEIVANLARYHTGKPPKPDHKNLETITSKKTLELIKTLSAFLRIADGLDRSHTEVIKDIKCKIDKESRTCTFILHSKSSNCSIELYGAGKKKNLFEEFFGYDVEFVVKHT